MLLVFYRLEDNIRREIHEPLSSVYFKDHNTPFWKAILQYPPWNFHLPEVVGGMGGFQGVLYGGYQVTIFWGRDKHIYEFRFFLRFRSVSKNVIEKNVPWNQFERTTGVVYTVLINIKDNTVTFTTSDYSSIATHRFIFLFFLFPPFFLFFPLFFNFPFFLSSLFSIFFSFFYCASRHLLHSQVVFHKPLIQSIAILLNLSSKWFFGFFSRITGFIAATNCDRTTLEVATDTNCGGCKLFCKG